MKKSGGNSIKKDSKKLTETNISPKKQDSILIPKLE